jgi:hypothetical protein
MAVTPISDWQFSIAVLHEGVQLAKRDPGALSDLHLKHIACYDQRHADQLERQRDRLIVARSMAAPTAPPVPPVVPGITDEQLEAIIQGLAGPLKAKFAALTAQITALETANAALKERVLLLEGTVAVRDVAR